MRRVSVVTGREAKASMRNGWIAGGARVEPTESKCKRSRRKPTPSAKDACSIKEENSPCTSHGRSAAADSNAFPGTVDMYMQYTLVERGVQ